MDYKNYFDSKAYQSKNKNTKELIRFFSKSELKDLSENTISIVGTNGKTSTANIIHKFLSQEKIKSTKFISPHLIDFKERIESSSEQNFINAFVEVKKFEEKAKLNLGYFEAFFLMSSKLFLLNNDQFFICEAGIGGKLDTTSIIQSENVVLTNIGYDHQELLGNSLLEILEQKINISQNIKNLFVGELDNNLISKIHLLNKNVEEIHYSNFIAEKIDLDIEQLSYIQKNALLALLVLEKIINYKHTDSIEDKVFEQPGRFEIVNNDPLKIIDGAHNVTGLQATLKDYAKKYNSKPIDVYIGFKIGKNYKDMILLISKYSFLNIYVINENQFYQQEKLENITNYLDSIKRKYEIVTLDHFDGNMNSSILIGSLYLVGEYKKRKKL
jgi:dihydrofolate synthase/folylpolyglutamate synthase